MLAYLAKESNCDVLAITYDNQIFPSGFLEFAKRRTNEIGINHEIIESNFLDVEPKNIDMCTHIFQMEHVKNVIMLIEIQVMPIHLV